MPTNALSPRAGIPLAGERFIKTTGRETVVIHTACPNLNDISNGVCSCAFLGLWSSGTHHATEKIAGFCLILSNLESLPCLWIRYICEHTCSAHEINSRALTCAKKVPNRPAQRRYMALAMS
jgi:hypothetical protein